MSRRISEKKMSKYCGRMESFKPEHAGLAWSFRVNPDSCDNPEHYEYYLRLNALTDAKIGMGKTYVYIADVDGKQKILGFATLKTNALVRTYNGKLSGEPALEITELAVCDGFEDQKIGTKLVQFAVSMAMTINSAYASVKHILICADPAAVGFYERMHFARLGDNGEVPREGWNENCIPMYLCLPTE